jgi:hypothetical protein
MVDDWGDFIRQQTTKESILAFQRHDRRSSRSSPRSLYLQANASANPSVHAAVQAPQTPPRSRVFPLRFSKYAFFVLYAPTINPIFLLVWNLF